MNRFMPSTPWRNSGVEASTFNEGVAKAPVSRLPWQLPGDSGRCVRCDVREGVPAVHGHAGSYYLSCPDGTLTLVLARKSGERIEVGGALDVVVLEVFGGQVKLGLRCPPRARHSRTS